MVDNKVPIIYLSGDELNTFSIQEDTTVFGHSYEWEGERVVHLRINPVLQKYRFMLFLLRHFSINISLLS